LLKIFDDFVIEYAIREIFCFFFLSKSFIMFETVGI